MNVQTVSHIARHEAGHFVVAMRQGHILDRVTIVPEGERTGLAVSSAGPVFGGDRRRMAMEQAVVFLAGPAAEGRLVDSISPSCLDNDAINARMQLSGVQDDEENRLMSCAEGWAQALVERWRVDIDRLAEVLIGRGSMTGDEVVELFGGPPVDDPDRPKLSC